MNLRKQIKKWLEAIAIRLAMEDTNTACACITYQPELPEVIKRVANSK